MSLGTYYFFTHKETCQKNFQTSAELGHMLFCMRVLCPKYFSIVAKVQVI